MKTTNEGLERGSLIVGPLGMGERRYLWTVTKVNGAHSVTAVTHLGNMVCEATINTTGLLNKDNPWTKVVFQQGIGGDDMGRVVKP